MTQAELPFGASHETSREVVVARGALLKVLELLLRQGKKNPESRVVWRTSPSKLSLALGDVQGEVPAEGTWEIPIATGKAGIPFLIEAVCAASDPVTLRTEEKRLRIGGSALECDPLPADLSVDIADLAAISATARPVDIVRACRGRTPEQLRANGADKLLAKALERVIKGRERILEVLDRLGAGRVTAELLVDRLLELNETDIPERQVNRTKSRSEA